jgi:formate transporter
MFLIPAGMILGAPVSISQWWMWNQVPVTLGNIVSGALLTGIALHVTHGTAAPVRETADEAGPSLIAAEEPAWAADAQVQ